MGVMHILASCGSYDLQRVVAPPPLAELTHIVGGTPGVVRVNYNGRPCIMIINMDGNALGLPLNKRASNICKFGTLPPCKIDAVMGDAIIIEGLHYEPVG